MVSDYHSNLYGLELSDLCNYFLCIWSIKLFHIFSQEIFDILNVVIWNKKEIHLNNCSMETIACFQCILVAKLEGILSLPSIFIIVITPCYLEDVIVTEKQFDKFLMRVYYLS